LDRQRT